MYADHAHENLTRTCMRRRAERSAGRNKKCCFLGRIKHVSTLWYAASRCPSQRFYITPSDHRLDARWTTLFSARLLLSDPHYHHCYSSSSAIHPGSSAERALSLGLDICQRIAITAAPLQLVTGRDDNEERERRYSLRQRMVTVQSTAEHHPTRHERCIALSITTNAQSALLTA